MRASLTPEAPATCPGGRTERALLDVCPPHTVRCVPDHGGACGVVTESRAASHSAPLTGERGSRGSDPEAAKAAGPAALPHHAGAGKQLCRAGGRRLHRAVRWMLQSWGGGRGSLQTLTPLLFPSSPRCTAGTAAWCAASASPPAGSGWHQVRPRTVAAAPNALALLELLRSLAVRQPGALHVSELLWGGGWGGGARAQSHSTASRSRSRLRGFFQDPTQESASQQRRK